MTKLSSRRIYSGRVLNLDIDTVRFPNGSTGELEIIRHPGAAAVLPFLSEPSGGDYILAIKNSTFGARRANAASPTALPRCSTRSR